TPTGSERHALQHGLRDSDRVFACTGDRHRRRPSLDVGAETGTRHGRRGCGRWWLLHVEGIEMKSVNSSQLRSCVTVLFAVALCAEPAEAHLNATGMGPIYDGLMHFLTSPEDLVPTLALALLAGLRGAAYGRRALFTLPAAWLLGSLFGLTV